jgi:hypothetical protein
MRSRGQAVAREGWHHHAHNTLLVRRARNRQIRLSFLIVIALRSHFFGVQLQLPASLADHEPIYKLMHDAQPQEHKYSKCGGLRQQYWRQKLVHSHLTPCKPGTHVQWWGTVTRPSARDVAVSALGGSIKIWLRRTSFGH